MCGVCGVYVCVRACACVGVISSRVRVSVNICVNVNLCVCVRARPVLGLVLELGSVLGLVLLGSV